MLIKSKPLTALYFDSCFTTHITKMLTKMRSSLGRLSQSWHKLVRTCLIFFCCALIPAIAHAIDAPTDARGTVVRSDEIKWEWNSVQDATRYQVNVNGSFVSMADNNFYYSRDLDAGSYTVTVQAVSSSGRYSSPLVVIPVVIQRPVTKVLRTMLSRLTAILAIQACQLHAIHVEPRYGLLKLNGNGRALTEPNNTKYSSTIIRSDSLTICSSTRRI